MTRHPSPQSTIAILIPCYNEGKTVAGVINGFRLQLPDADIYVYDNNSTDNTAEEARRAGATVRSENRQGKGNVVRSMFREVDADVYVMVDGDGTYPPENVHELIRPIVTGDADMVIGSRLHTLSDSHFKPLNRIGNRLFLFLLNSIFRVNITDLLSGYRAFSRRVVKSLPIISRGFEIETELTVKCLERNYRVVEVPISLSPRPKGSKSKIKIFRDGFLIFNTIFALFRDYKPLTAFGLVGLILVVSGFIPGTVVIKEFIATGYINRIPSAILAVGLVLSGLLVAFVGLVLHTISRRFQELDCQLQNLIGCVEQPDAKKKDNSRKLP
ncbi:MAG TPA: glycosyltransferase [Nitrospirae bacterium]|nr:glycosyltransferase [Nitrospirota bacterium]